MRQPTHMDWIRGLSEKLQQNGIEVLLDQWDVHPGTDLPGYMEAALRNANHVLLICTPTFADKTNSGQGGVGYEKTPDPTEYLLLPVPCLA